MGPLLQLEEESPIIYEIVAGNVSSALYGMFTLLCLASIYFLVQGNNHGTRRRVTLMLGLTLLALFTSTTVFTVYSLLWAKYNIISWLAISTQGLYSMYQTCNCAQTATLTVNIILGDAIVCWRAYTVWRGSKFIMCASIIFLLATFALATVDTKYTCSYSLSSGSDPTQPYSKAYGYGGLYQGVSYGVVASVLSLVTNLFATSVVAWKAWQTRRTLRRYIVIGSTLAQSGKIMSMIVESGAVYCGIWVLVVAYQIGNFTRDLDSEQCSLNISCQTKFYHSFWYTFGLVIDSSLVPAIAIYPTIIIILIALNRSHMETGLMKATESGSGAPLLLLPIVTTAETAVTTRCGVEQSAATALAVHGREEYFGSRGSSTYSEEERKLDLII